MMLIAVKHDLYLEGRHQLHFRRYEPKRSVQFVNFLELPLILQYATFYQTNVTTNSSWYIPWVINTFLVVLAKKRHFQEGAAYFVLFIRYKLKVPISNDE